MLVLNRRLGEAIVIDGGIEIVVLSVERGKVSLGCIAPSDLRIMRKELLEPEELERMMCEGD